MTAPFVFEPLEATGELVAAGTTPATRAAEIVAEAEARAAEIAAEARAAGFAAGRAEALEAAGRDLDETRALLVAALAAVQAAQEEFVAEAERHAVELGVAIAEKVVGAALDVDPQLVCEVVGGALRRVADRDRLVLEVNPQDVELVRPWLETAGGVVAGHVELSAERRVARGGCVVRTAAGEVDAQIHEQLGRARELLTDAFAARKAA
jgi:flagellar biosynthesis/type III secretory pathway protein FliH